MRLRTLFSSTVLLVSCSGIPLQEVKIPIAVVCVTGLPTKPTMSLTLLPKDPPIFDSVLALLTDREALEAYTTGLEAILEACK